MPLGSYLAEEIAVDCAEGLLTRREALRRLTLLGLSTMGAAALLAACGSDAEESAATTAGPTTASPTTSTLAPSAAAEEIRFAGPSGELIGALATAPKAKGAVLVIHENRGLTPHIRSIPPRLADDGYTALALDLLSEEGGTASLPSEGDATAALGRAPAGRMIADLRAGLDDLARRAPNAKLAVIGFCFGGGMTWQLLAAGEPRVSAAVPFYGPFTHGMSFARSPNAALAAVYGALDSPGDATRARAAAALDAARPVRPAHAYHGAAH